MTRRIFLALLVFIVFFLTFTHAQEEGEEEPIPSPSPEPPFVEEPTPTFPSPTTDISPDPTFTPTFPTETPTTPTVPPSTTPAPIPNQPNPVFSTSDTCVTCQRNWGLVRNCTALIPPPTVNLTMISQVLPFFNCICPNNGIDALQGCSTCFRSTGQQAFLNPKHYEVTNQDNKAFKQVCLDTENGSKVPSAAVSKYFGGVWGNSVGLTILSVVVIAVSSI
ncbi:hypothetical protein BG004_008459 [Podila humilis]|nr:hypothetical protein BG004_008459 [Podila humilis]